MTDIIYLVYKLIFTCQRQKKACESGIYIRKRYKDTAVLKLESRS